MAQPCPEAELCPNFNCHNLHPPSWWKCDYGPLCFVPGCEGVHPEKCKQNPCRNIKNCNYSHIDACQYGATCGNPNCHNLHPPPCADPNCNGANCIFLHRNQPKYESVSSLTFQQRGTQNKNTGNAGINQNRGGFNANAAPSPGWAASAPMPSNQATSSSAPNQNFKKPISEVPCRYNPCTKPNCPFLH